MPLVQHHPWVLLIALALALAEFGWRRATGRSYDLKQAATSLGVAAVQTLLRPINMLVTVAILTLFARAAPWHLPMGDWRVWVLGFFAVDFAYYWFHRWSHEIAWMWATHAVHHSATEMVLPAAIRLGWTEALSLGWLAFVPLVLFGLPPKMVGIWLALGLVYQYVLHTEAPITLGPLEGVLNSPAHHRVHHSRDAEFLDCNYGGVLIVWDRMFGTFRRLPPGATLHYGLVHPLPRSGVLAIGLGPFAALLRQMAAAPGWGEKLRIALGRPR